MIKKKVEYACAECGAIHPKWLGQCIECKEWNSIEEIIIDNSKPIALQGLASSSPQSLNHVVTKNYNRISTGISELDRTLGGDLNYGLVEGSVVLIGGDPGIGKSTLILQVLANINSNHKTLYVSGEESIQQIGNRAKRLKISSDIALLSEINLEKIITIAKSITPKVMVIDSIQTMMSEHISSSAGSISQVRDCASILTQFAKQANIILLMIGHVTKGGTIAGPKILEHMVDCVLSFEGDAAGRYRVIRGVKNRFGAINEISVFAMLEDGLKQVLNPSAIFLSQNKAVAGRVIMVTREGARPMLIEVQALVDKASDNPKRVCVGLEQNRLILQLAILHKHANIVTYNKDVFVNIVGGIKLTETASDLAVMLAIFSSLTDKALPDDMVVFGEIGLTGEVRPVYNAIERISEAQKQGFKTAIIPIQNSPKKAIKGMKIITVAYLHQAVNYINNF